MTTTDPHAAPDTFAAIRRVLWITMGMNLIATVAKLAVGYATGALSLVADGYDSVFDSASNIIGLVGIGVASRPPDERHPYGHRKAETLSALVIAMLLFVTTWELAKSAVERLRNPSLIAGQATWLSFGALAVSIAVHILVVWYEMREGRRLKSEVLVADAMHTRADIFVSLAVAGGLLAVRLGIPIADPLMALVVAAAIGKIGVDIVRQTTSALMDEVALPTSALEPIILSVPGVASAHRVRTRGHEAAVMADLHIRVDPAMSAAQAHALAHEVQHRLAQAQPSLHDITVHVEPSASPSVETPQQQITTRLRRLADGQGLGVHSVWAHHLDDAYYVDVHLEADGALPLRDVHAMASEFEARAVAEIPDIAEVTTHLEPTGLLVAADQSEATDDSTVAAVREVVARRLGPDPCHDVRVIQGIEGRTVSLHCYLPGDATLAEAHRAGDALEHEILAAVPGVTRVFVHTEPRLS